MIIRGNNRSETQAHSALQMYTNTELPSVTNQKGSLREASQERSRKGPGSRNASLNNVSESKYLALPVNLQNNASPNMIQGVNANSTKM